MLRIYGKTLLERVIERAKIIDGADTIILATSTLQADDILAEHALKNGIKIFRGSLENVAERALGVCEEYKVQKFARVCGDRPFFEPKLVSSLIYSHNKLKVDIATTTFPRTYPPGLTGEVLSTNALRLGYPKMNKSDKEHLTTYFYRNYQNFRIYSHPAPKNLDMKGIDLCVDDQIGLDKAEWIASQLNYDIGSDTETGRIIELARQWKYQKSVS